MSDQEGSLFALLTVYVFTNAALEIWFLKSSLFVLKHGFTKVI